MFLWIVFLSFFFFFFFCWKSCIFVLLQLRCCWCCYCSCNYLSLFSKLVSCLFVVLYPGINVWTCRMPQCASGATEDKPQKWIASDITLRFGQESAEEMQIKQIKERSNEWGCGGVLQQWFHRNDNIPDALHWLFWTPRGLQIFSELLVVVLLSYCSCFLQGFALK